MKALKEWGEQYELGQKKQAEQVEALGRQVSNLTGQVESLAEGYRKGEQADDNDQRHTAHVQDPTR